MLTMTPPRTVEVTPHTFIGVSLALLGVVLTLDNLGFVDGQDVLRFVLRFWPVVPILVGAVYVVQGRETRDWFVGSRLDRGRRRVPAAQPGRLPFPAAGLPAADPGRASACASCSAAGPAAGRAALAGDARSRAAAASRRAAGFRSDGRPRRSRRASIRGLAAGRRPAPRRHGDGRGAAPRPTCCGRSRSSGAPIAGIAAPVAHVEVSAVMGGCDIDLRDAVPTDRSAGDPGVRDVGRHRHPRAARLADPE